MTSINEIWGLQTALEEKAERGHAHRIRDIEGLQDALNNQGENGSAQPAYIEDIAGLQDALDSKAPWSQVNALADSLDGKAAAAHGHGIDAIADLEGILDGKAAAAHGHGITDITGLQDALDSKAEAGGSGSPLAIADVTGLTDALAAKQAADPANPALLTYTISQSTAWVSGTYASVTDGSSTTGAMSTNSGNQWIKASFAQITRFNRIAFAGGILPSWGATAALLNGSFIEVSTDNTIWMSLCGMAPISDVLDDGSLRWYAFPYIAALNIRVRRASGTIGLSEFRIYG